MKYLCMWLLYIYKDNVCFFVILVGSQSLSIFMINLVITIVKNLVLIEKQEFLIQEFIVVFTSLLQLDTGKIAVNHSLCNNSNMSRRSSFHFKTPRQVQNTNTIESKVILVTFMVFWKWRKTLLCMFEVSCKKIVGKVSPIYVISMSYFKPQGYHLFVFVKYNLFCFYKI